MTAMSPEPLSAEEVALMGIDLAVALLKERDRLDDEGSCVLCRGYMRCYPTCPLELAQPLAALDALRGTTR